MPSPFLSYLRVYEPLRAFDDDDNDDDGSLGASVRAGMARGPIPPEAAGRRDRELCLRAQLRAQALPEPHTDVLITEGPDGDPLVCPLDTRARAGAALLTFLAAEAPLLHSAALPAPAAAARRTAEAAVAELGSGAAHIISASWTVPLPWFALVEQAGRRMNLEPRRVWWQVPMAQARRRAARAETIVREGIGDEGPAEVLAETRAWLARFDRDSVVELDYGGLVELLDDEALQSDSCAADVRTALRALREGDGEAAGACYGRLREFWSMVTVHENSG